MPVAVEQSPLPAPVTPTTDEEQVRNGTWNQGQGTLPPSISNQAPASEPQSITQPTPANAAAGGVQAAKYYNGDKSFDTRGAAEKDATGKIVSKEDHMANVIYPQVRDFYIKEGDMEKAKAWDEYATSQKGRNALKAWAKGATSPSLDKLAGNFGSYYTDYIDDGIDYVGHRTLRKSDGTDVAVIKLKDKATGTESEMELTHDAIISLGAAANPKTLFDEKYAEQKEVRAFKIKSDIQAGHDKALLERANVLEKGKDNRQAESDAARANREEQNIRLKARLETEFKKTTAPEERRAIIATELMKSDPKFAKFSSKEKSAAIDDVMSAIGGAKSSADSSSPQDSGFYRDKQTGEVFKMENGKRVPLKPVASSPAATGLPNAGAK